MVKEDVLARYLAPLLRGDRKACRSVVEETLQSGIPANSVYLHLIWPVMAEIERLSRMDKITSVQEHLATRINRTIVDQLQNKLPRRPARHKRVAVACARDELQELGAQIIADLFESARGAAFLPPVAGAWTPGSRRGSCWASVCRA